MPTTPATRGTSARTVDERFLDLICNDQDLLDAEFDAIIAAEWPGPPTDPAGRGVTGGEHPVSGAARWVSTHVGGAASRPRHPGIGGWARQRSPPPGQPDRRRTGR